MKNRLMIVLEKLLILLLAVMTVDVIWQVLSRYVLGSPSNFTDELAGFLLIWLGVFGATYVTGKQEHVAIDMLSQVVKPKYKARLFVIGRLCIVLFALPVMVIGGANLTYLTFVLDQRSASLHLPLGYVYACIPIAGMIITYFAIQAAFFQTQMSTSDGSH